MMGSGLALLVLGFLLAVAGIVIGSLCTYDIFNGYSCSPSSLLPLAGSTFLFLGGGVFSMIIGTVFTAVGYSKGTKQEISKVIEKGKTS